jgi:mannose/fructose/N-acetylgalactosamine-specific phosphotransferase system component IID
MKLDNRIVHRMVLAAERGDTGAIVWLNIVPAQALLLAITTLPAALLGLVLPSIVNALAGLAPQVVLKGLGLAGTGLAGALGIALAMKFVFKGHGVIVFLIGYALIAATEINVAIFVLAAMVLLLASDLVKLGRYGSGLGWNRATGAFLLWQFFSHSSYSFERLQGSGVASAFAPTLRRLYSATPDRVAALKRHLAFFNVEPNWGSVVIGVALKMEEQHAAGIVDAETVTATKQALMGTVSGFGDTVSQGAILPLLLSIGLSISLSTSAVAWPATGVITYLALICPVMLAISALCFNAGYTYGRDAVITILANTRLKWWITVAELVGAFMLGVLAAMQKVTGLHLGNPFLSQPIVDIPLRLGIVMLFYGLVQRFHIKPTIVLAGIVIASLLVALSGVL